MRSELLTMMQYIELFKFIRKVYEIWCKDRPGELVFWIKYKIRDIGEKDFFIHYKARYTSFKIILIFINTYNYIRLIFALYDLNLKHINVFIKRMEYGGSLKFNYIWDKTIII